jgi:hypothetical protein
MVKWEVWKNEEVNIVLIVPLGWVVWTGSKKKNSYIRPILCLKSLESTMKPYQQVTENYLVYLKRCLLSFRLYIRLPQAVSGDPSRQFILIIGVNPSLLLPLQTDQCLDFPSKLLVLMSRLQWPVKLETSCSSETLASTYITMQCHSNKTANWKILHHENPKIWIWERQEWEVDQEIEVRWGGRGWTYSWRRKVAGKSM